MVEASAQKKYKIVISDCHLSAGRVFEGRLNPHEDFHFDAEMCEMFNYFSTGLYGESARGPVDVELFINGDFFDFLNVPVQGEFEDVITEKMAVMKCEAIIEGHQKVMAALKRFAACPGKKITYLVGNHDADLFFPKVRERIIREWDAEGRFPSPNVEILVDRDRVRWEGGVEVHHGNQFEAVHVLNFEKPLLEQPGYEDAVLNLPWGSFFVLKIINRLKVEREYIDKVRPVRVVVLVGLLTDPLFTLKFCFLSAFYFLKTRFVYSRKRRSRLSVTAKILKEESSKMLLDLESEARQTLASDPSVKTVIFGHTHKPMDKVYPDGTQYINTGTWTKMINLDWRHLGQQYSLTFAHVTLEGDQSFCELRQWVGEQSPHRVYRG